ncbi:MAG: flagellar hook-length control protein FliK [Lachnospiraceae bacterium]|nr:flagellar hook-length control protein FliK [Lachnospiraceae bacterium]
MTGVPATSAKAFAVNLPVGAAQGNISGNMGQSFADIMSGREGQLEMSVGRSQAKASGNEKRISVNNENSQSDKISKAAESGKKPEALTKDEAVRLEETANELKEEIADALDVTVEELEAAMEAMGLSFVDLLNPANLAGLVTELSEELDGLALVTDETLFGGLKELSAQIATTVEDLAGELGMKPEEIAAMLEKAVDQAGDEWKPEEGMAEETVSLEHFEALTEEKTSGMDMKASGVSKDVQEKAPVTEETGVYHSAQKEVSSVEADAAKQQSSQENLRDEGRGAKSNRSFGQETAASVVPQAVSAESKSMSIEMEAPLPAVDPQSILNQIGEAVRVTGGEDFTSMEMQLHPESLGTLHLQVRAKEGIITAQFTTESEAVKQVLEAQVMQLREKLEAQGVKVEAVEVLVASHEFERNLEKGGSEEKNAYEAKKVTRRKINLNVLEEEEPDLLEEEKEAMEIQKDMMERNGNTLDYMV